MFPSRTNKFPKIPKISYGFNWHQTSKRKQKCGAKKPPQDTGVITYLLLEKPGSVLAASHSLWSTLSRWYYTPLVVLWYLIVCCIMVVWWSTLSRWYYTRPGQYRGKRSSAEDISLYAPFVFSTQSKCAFPNSSSRSSCSSENGLFLTLRLLSLGRQLEAQIRDTRLETH